jgi:putative transcriptional regulator
MAGMIASNTRRGTAGVKRLAVSRQSVNAIETGKYDPSLPLAFRIAELFGLSIEEVFESPSRRSSKAI